MECPKAHAVLTGIEVVRFLLRGQTAIFTRIPGDFRGLPGISGDSPGLPGVSRAALESSVGQAGAGETPQEAPETPKERSKTPKMTPRRPKRPPRRSRMPPRRLTRGPREAKIVNFTMVLERFWPSCLFGFPTLQDSSRGPQDRPKTAQEAPKSAPRRPKRAPSGQNH